MKNIKVKLIISIMLIIMLSGCTVTYRVNIDDSEIRETISLFRPNTNIDNEDIINELNIIYGRQYSINDDFSLFYECEDENSCQEMPNVLKILADRETETWDLFLETSLIKKYFGNISINESTEIVSITATPKSQLEAVIRDIDFVKARMNKLEIIISTDYDVIDHNADNVNDGFYTWIYDKNNYTKPIKFVYKITDHVKDDINTIKKENTNIIFFILACLALLGCLILLSKKKKNDEL